MKKLFCKTCTDGNSFPLFGSGFSRRRFFRVAGTGLVGSYFLDLASPPRRVEAATAPVLRGTARKAILIFLSGAPSHTDTWDLKEGAWTPSDFAPTTFGGSLRFPQGLLPKTAEQLGHMAFIRSSLSWAAVHSLSQTWAQIARNPTGALGNIAPHIGAVVALEAQAKRKPTDVLPGFVALNSGGIPGPGYFPASYAPFRIAPGNGTGLTSLVHPDRNADGSSRLPARYDLIRTLDSDRTDGSLGKGSTDMDEFYVNAKTLIDSPDTSGLFKFTTAERAPYGNTGFGDSLLIARNLVGAARGTRFVQVTLGGWDNHSNIYQRPGGLYGQCAAFDPAFGALLSDLATRPGEFAGQTLLDETLVVVIGEFGRTVGALNANGGRDHFLRMSVVMAGGGVRGGRVIGQTDARGDKVVDYGWSGNRDVRPEDVAATIYSALGIDYTTVRRDDPVGRGFEYVPFAKDGVYKPVDEVF